MNLITGATGLVGTAICMELLKSGEPVRALVRKDSDRSWMQKVFDFHHLAEAFTTIHWCEGDILDLESLEKAMQGCTDVYHTAAMVSFNPADEKQLMQINATGTENVVNVASGVGLRKFCHISSTAALGRTKSGQTIDEDNNWEKSKLNSPYAISKYAAEREVWRAHVEGLPVVILNPSVVIGPGNPARSSSAMLARVARGFKHYPKGGNGFVGLQDVARAAVYLTKSEISGERFIVNGENLPYQRLFEMMSSALGVQAPSKPVSQGMLNLARKAQGLWQKLSGKRAILTRASVRNASNVVLYSNKKLLQAGFEFKPLGDSIATAATFFKSHGPS